MQQYRILVTGGAGFIGSNLVDTLLKDPRVSFVRVLDNLSNGHRHNIEEFIDDLERDLKELGEKEFPAAVLGEKIMLKLHDLDDVAYVRFASVYREFKDVNDFVSELRTLLSQHDK